MQQSTRGDAAARFIRASPHRSQLFCVPSIDMIRYAQSQLRAAAFGSPSQLQQRSPTSSLAHSGRSSVLSHPANTRGGSHKRRASRIDDDDDDVNSASAESKEGDNDDHDEVASVDDEVDSVESVVGSDGDVGDDDETEKENASAAAATVCEKPDHSPVKLSTQNKRIKNSADASPSGAQATKVKKTNKAKKNPADRTPTQVLKAQNKNLYAEVSHDRIIAHVPAAVAPPLDPDVSNGWMRAMSLVQLKSLSLWVDRRTARVLRCIVVSHMMFDDSSGSTGGGHHLASQRVYINGVYVGKIDRDFLALSSLQRRKEKAEQDAKRANQAERLRAEIVFREFPRITIVSAAPNAFAKNAHAVFPSQNVTKFGSTQVSQQAVGRGKPVATYLCFYVDPADVNATITLDRMQSQCSEHRRCEAHGQCQLKPGYKATDVIRTLNEHGGFGESTTGEYDVPIIAKPSKITVAASVPAAAAATSAAAAVVPQAAAPTQAPLTPRTTPSAPPRRNYTTVSKKATAASATAQAAAYPANAATATSRNHTQMEFPAALGQAAATPSRLAPHAAQNAPAAAAAQSNPAQVAFAPAPVLWPSLLNHCNQHEQHSQTPHNGLGMVDQTDPWQLVPQVASVDVVSPSPPNSPDSGSSMATEMVADREIGLGDDSPPRGLEYCNDPPAAAAGAVARSPLPRSPSPLLDSSPQLKLRSSDDSSFSQPLPVGYFRNLWANNPTLPSTLPRKPNPAAAAAAETAEAHFPFPLPSSESASASEFASCACCCPLCF